MCWINSFANIEEKNVLKQEKMFQLENIKAVENSWKKQKNDL